MIINNSIMRAITGFFLLLAISFLYHSSSPIFFIGVLFSWSIMIKELYAMNLRTNKFIAISLWYISIPWCIILYFHCNAHYKILLFHLFITNFIFDTASYIFGKSYNYFWTTHKIVPKISPNKSWQGFIGGYLTTTLYVLYFIKNSYCMTLLTTLIFCSIAFLGDIFESSLKRFSKIKDSGNILPGHGGLLDRFDGILATSYVFLLFKNYILNVLS